MSRSYPHRAPAHAVAFYITDDFLIGRIADFVRDGLDAGEQVVVVATNSHWTAVAQRLDERGVPHGKASEQRQLIVVDAEWVLEHIMVDGLASAERFRDVLARLLKPPYKYRIYGEVVALLAARGEIDAAASIEELGQQLSRGMDIPILCAYHAAGQRTLSAAEMSRITGLHDHAVQEPVHVLGRTSGHFHAVRFYQDETELSAIVARFIAEGLGAMQPALIIATPVHRERIAAQLHGRGLDVQGLQNEKRLFMLDADDTLSRFMVGGMPDRDRFRHTIVPVIEEACGNRRDCTVRAYGEMVDVLWRQGRTVGAIRLEMLWNELASTHDFCLLCGYSMGHFYKDADVNDVSAHHSHVVAASGEREAVDRF